MLFVLAFGCGIVLRRAGLATAANVAQLVSLLSIPVGLVNWARGRKSPGTDRPPDRPGAGPGARPGLAMLYGSAGLACVTGVALVLREAGIVPPAARRALDWGVVIAALAACAVLALYWHRNRSQLMVPSGPLRTLLERQRDLAQRHQYAYTVGTAPPVQEIYVEQWAEWLSPATGTGRAAPVSLAQMMRVSPNAIVLAEPGVGKSTAVAQVIWHQCTWWLDARRWMRPHDAPYGPVIPLLLPADLRGCRTLPEAMARQWKELTGTAMEATALGRKPPAGQAWLVLIDGIDQVLSTGERVDLLSRVGEWISERPASWRLLATSRPLLSGELGWLKAEHVGRFVLRKFDADGLREFAVRWAGFRQAQHLAGVEIQPITADMFLAALRASSLMSLARVPLIATITALILEGDREAALPTSRAGLYERFVVHLFTSRRVARIREQAPPQLAAYGVPGRRAWRWLVDNLRDLLEGTAHKHLSAGAPGMIACARQWAQENAPGGLLRPVPGWDDTLKGLLIATSLVVPGPAGLRWAHPNFAEYLAAGPRGREFDLETWLADARSPDSRNLALFVLGREATGDLADRLTKLLLDRGGEDTCIAGAIVADGIAVAADLRHRVTEGLLSRLAEDGADLSTVLDTLVSLIGRGEVLDRLVAFAEDPAQPAWVRADVADELCGVSRQTGARLLRLVLDGTGDWLLRDRILFKLAEHGELRDNDRAPAAPGAQAGATSAGRRAGDWYRQIAGNPGAQASQRVRALLAMAERRDPGWQSLLAGIITDPALPDDTRRDAARRIIRLDDQAGSQVIQHVANEEDLGLEVRVPLLASLVEAQDDAARVMLNGIIARGGADFRRRFPAIAAWTEVAGPRSSEQPSGPAPAFWGNVPPRNKNFTGREEILARLWQASAIAGSTGNEKKQGSPPSVTLQGLAGVGKTSIAVEYAYRHRAEYDLIWWVPANERAWVISALAALAGRMGLAAGVSSGAWDAEGAARAAADALSRGDPFRRWLLIIDNADQPEEIQDLIPRGPGDVLITSRNHRWQSLVSTVAVDGFTRAESAALLVKRVPQGMEPQDADRLADRLGDLPLALEQAGATLAETKMPASEYLRRFDENITSLLALGKPQDYPLSVTAAWRLAVQALQQQLPPARELLRLLAFFGPEPVPRDVLRLGGSRAMTALRDVLGDPVMLARATRELGRFALVVLDSRSILVHRLISALVRDELSAAERDRYRHEAHLVLASLPDNPDDLRRWPRFHELLPHLSAPALELQRCQDEQVRDFALRAMRYLIASGDPAACQVLAGKCIAQWTADSGPDAADVQHARHHLGTALRLLGMYPDALRVTGEAITRARRTRGEHDPLTLSLREALAADLRIKGDFSAALALDEDTLEILRGQPAGDDQHVRLLHVMNALAMDRALTGDYRAAVALSLQSQSWSAENARLERLAPADMRAARITLSWALRMSGNYEEARAVSVEAFDTARELLGVEHSTTLRAMREASIVLRQDKVPADEALFLGREAFTLTGRLLGEGHPDTLAAGASLANTLRASGQVAQALPLAEMVASRYPGAYDAQHPFSHACSGNLAVLRRAAGSPGQARELNEAALAGLDAALGRDHPYTLAVAANLASDYAALGDNAAARALGQDTLERLQRTLGPDHPVTLGCALNLAQDFQAGHDLDFDPPAL
jgi:hypothetical protein